MTWLYVLLGIVLALWLISLIRVGVVAEYTQDGLEVRLRAGPVRMTVYPVRPEPEKPERPKRDKKKDKPPKEQEKTDLKEKLGGALPVILDLIPLAAEAAGTLLHKLRMDELVLHLTWAAPDPADAAMGFGAGQAVLDTLLPLLERGFHIKKRDVGVAVDFERTAPALYARSALSLSVGQCVAFAAVYGVRALSLLLRHSKKNRIKTVSGAQVTPN